MENKSFFQRNSKTFTRIILILIILGASYMGSEYFKSMKTDPPSRPKAENKILVKSRTVSYTELLPIVNEGGRLGSQQKLDIISEVQGEILSAQIPLKKGENFKKGDLLVNIFDDEAAYNLQAGKSRFLNAIANALPDFRIDYEESYENWLSFFNSIDITKPLPELPEFKSSQEKTFLASRGILNDYYTIKSSEIRLSKYRIYAPFDGSYTNVYLERGSIANMGSRIAQIIRTDKLELEIPIKVEEIAWIHEGDNVKITSENNQAFSGVVIRVSDFVDPNTQSIPVFIRLDYDNDVRLYEGMYLRAHFEGRPIKDVMEIPRNAVFNFDEVFVVEDGKLKKRTIEIMKINSKTVFFKGLPEGSTIVVEPLVNVEEGIKVDQTQG